MMFNKDKKQFGNFCPSLWLAKLILNIDSVMQNISCPSQLPISANIYISFLNRLWYLEWSGWLERCNIYKVDGI